MSRRSTVIRTLAAAVTAAALTAPAALAMPPENDRPPDPNGTVATQDVRSPDVKPNVGVTITEIAAAQDLRSADARIAGTPSAPGPQGVGAQEVGTGDATDTVRPLPRYVSRDNAVPGSPGTPDDSPLGIIALTVAGAGLAIGAVAAIGGRTRLRARRTRVAV